MDAEPLRGRSDARRRTAGAILRTLSGAFNPLRGQAIERTLRAINPLFHRQEVIYENCN